LPANRRPMEAKMSVARWIYVAALLVASTAARQASATDAGMDGSAAPSMQPFVRPIPRGAVQSSSVPTLTVMTLSDLQDGGLPESSLGASQGTAQALSGSVATPMSNPAVRPPARTTSPTGEAGRSSRRPASGRTSGVNGMPQPRVRFRRKLIRLPTPPPSIAAFSSTTLVREVRVPR